MKRGKKRKEKSVSRDMVCERCVSGKRGKKGGKVSTDKETQRDREGGRGRE